MKGPCLVACDAGGHAFDVPDLLMAGASLGQWRQPDIAELMPVPAASSFFSLPGRYPVGFDPRRKKLVVLREYRGAPVQAAAVFLPPGYLQFLSAAYEQEPAAPRLPLFCYTAVGWTNGRFVAAGQLIDRQLRHHIPPAWAGRIARGAASLIKRYPRNRLVRHLVNHCVFEYRCPNACNLVLGRMECPIPVSPACNARCVGCISHQPAASCIPSTQHRLDFVPTCAEICEYVAPHLQHAADPIASFGQGCEGEPLLQARLVEQAIKAIRARTARGVLNMNTNASRPADVERLCKAGLDSLRVSLNSAQPEYYHAYYQPRGYALADVVESIRIARRHGVWVSLNYLVFPGFTDSRGELRALENLLRATDVNMIQARNLNMDPAWYAQVLGRAPRGKTVGMLAWAQWLRRRFPRVRLGYFNPTRATLRGQASRPGAGLATDP